MKKLGKQTGIIIVLAVLLAISVGYTGVNAWQQMRDQELTSILQQGVQVGYQQAVQQLIQQALTCQPVPVQFQNQTINVIAVECLEQPT